MKSKHDVWAQQSRRRFLADTALGAAGLGLGAAGMESAQAQTCLLYTSPSPRDS